MALMSWMRAGGGISGFDVPTHVRTTMFFDKAAVENALDRMERKSLSRASLLVRRNAQKSIRKMGMAKPLLKEQKANPEMRLTELVRQPGIKEGRRKRIVERMREVKTRPPSAPGTPPHTHVPHGMMLGFRRNLYNAYDSGTHSAVVGPSKKGDLWTIPHLHEFGGGMKLRAWVFDPQYQGYRKPIIIWVAAQKTMKGQWRPTGATKTAIYPARPYMRPALTKSMPSFPKFFEGAFSAGVVGG